MMIKYEKQSSCNYNYFIILSSDKTIYSRSTLLEYYGLKKMILKFFLISYLLIYMKFKFYNCIMFISFLVFVL